MDNFTLRGPVSCGYPPDDEKKTGMKVVVNDTLQQGRKKEEGGVRVNKT